MNAKVSTQMRIERRNRRRTYPNRTAEPLERRTFLSAGDLDPSFGLGGIAGVDITGSDWVTAVDVANGRVVLGGVVTAQAGTSNAQPRVALTVLDTAGKPVTSFSGDGVETELLRVGGGVLDMAVQPDNKIVVLAGDNTFGSSGARVLARFNANGTLDRTFGIAGDGQLLLPEGSSAVALAPGGKIIVAQGQTNGGVSVMRFTSAGRSDGQVVDPVGTTPTDNLTGIRDVLVQPDGKVVVAGSVVEPLGTDGFIARFTSSLTSLDAGFGNGGILTYDSGIPQDNIDVVTALAQDGQGRILAGIFMEAGRATVSRLLPNGDGDPTFTGGGDFAFSSGGQVWDVAVAPDGKVVASGTTFAEGDSLVRFNTNGSRDTSFGGGDGRLLDVRDNEAVGGRFSDVQPDGRIITTGAGLGFQALRHVSSNSMPVGTAVLGTDRVLRVTGTEAGNDDVRIDDDGVTNDTPSPISVFINGRTTYFAKRDVDRIEVKTLGGNDRVSDLDFADPGAISFAGRRIDGGPGNDELHGGRGRDTLLGLVGNDRLFGNAGDDLLDGGLGTDVQLGGAGADTIDYHFRTSALRVDLEGDADDGAAGERDTVGADVEHILGGSGSDTLTGNALPNYIRGNGGNDTIRGGGGNDALYGDAGQDRLFGDAGNDYLDARDGITDLVLDGGAGTDTARKDGSDPTTGIEALA